MTLDVADLDAYVPFMEKLREMMSQKQIRLISGSDKESIVDSLWSARSYGYFSDKQVHKVIKFLDEDDNNVKQMVKLLNDPEWSLSLDELKMEKEILTSLTEDDEFLGQWLDFVWKQASDEQTAKIRDLNRRVDILYEKGRLALDLKLTDLSVSV